MIKASDLPKNCEYPQLASIVNADKLAAALRQHREFAALHPQTQIAGCSLEKLYYRPGGVCRILFTTDFSKNGNGKNDTQFFFGKVVPPEQVGSEMAALSAQSMTAPKYGPPWFVLPEWDMIVWAYPNDPVLPGLALLENPAALQQEMHLAPELFGLTAPAKSIKTRMGKYVPGKRCGFSYQIKHEHGESTLYGKAYESGKGLAAYRILQQIWDGEARRSGKLLMPQPYSFDTLREIIWQEALPGRPLAKSIKQIKGLPEKAAEIGQRLAAFHNDPLDLPVNCTLDFQIEEVRSSFKKVLKAFPEISGQYTGLQQRMLAVAERMEAPPLTPIHKSFKFSHIFETDRGIAFIDFDGANLGDPAYDVGRFIAHLLKYSAAGKISDALADRVTENFCTGYNRAAKNPLPQSHINWFAASHVIGSEVYKSVKRFKPGALKRLMAYVEKLVPA